MMHRSPPAALSAAAHERVPAGGEMILRMQVLAVIGVAIRRGLRHRGRAHWAVRLRQRNGPRRMRMGPRTVWVLASRRDLAGACRAKRQTVLFTGYGHGILRGRRGRWSLVRCVARVGINLCGCTLLRFFEVSLAWHVLHG